MVYKNSNRNVGITNGIFFAIIKYVNLTKTKSNLNYLSKEKNGETMKKLSLSTLILLGILYLSAIPQSIRDITTVAENYLNYKNIHSNYHLDFTMQTGDNSAEIFVFNLEPTGFIAISGDNDLTPVLSYSTKNSLNEENQDENYLLMMLKGDVKLRMEYYSQNRADAIANHLLWEKYLQNNIGTRDYQQWPAEGSSITDGWLETAWNQSGVFYQFCPLDNSGQRSVVGCVATAMSMIVEFHEYIGGAQFNISDDYQTYTNEINIDNDYIAHDFPSFPQLNDYLTTLNQHYTDGVLRTADDYAALCFACGISVQMDYDSSGSGAWTQLVADALVDKFGFDSANWIENEGNSFYSHMQEDMMQMQPIEITIYLADWTGGHAINVDGYNTDDYYHLNFGWGTSNSTCWYLLPSGMPSNYSIITGGVMDIEGGITPFEIDGNVSVDGGISLEGTYIKLAGQKTYEMYVTESTGDFTLPAVLPGVYTASAIQNGRMYYQELEIEITNENDFIQFNLGNFEQVTGIVSAPISTQGAIVSFYQEDELIYSAVANENGEYVIMDIFPGEYRVQASLGSNYFQSFETEISLENMEVDFELTEFLGEMEFSKSKLITNNIFTLIPNTDIGVAIKLAGDDLSIFQDDIISGVKFRLPVNNTQAQVFAQIWEGENLLSEKEVLDFEENEWNNVYFDNFIPINLDKEYYIGYKINSSNGKLVYIDNGLRSEGGAFFRTNSWVKLPENHDFNFDIQAEIITNIFGTVSGNIDLVGGIGEIDNAIVKGGKFSARADDSGNYEMKVKPNSYFLNAFLDNYENGANVIILISNGSVHNNTNFTLTYLVGEENKSAISFNNELSGNYPNPFNPTTSIQFEINKSGLTELTIYNVKGELVNTLVSEFLSSGKYSRQWNGKDDENRQVSSGMYFYKLKNGSFSCTRKMILLK